MPNHQLQSVTLRVRNIDAARRFYHELVGLDVLSASPERCSLGAGGEPIVELVASPDAPSRTSQAGLFHLAILFPDRQSLADALSRLSQADYPLTGAADHAVSEALYMDDPDGNGVELYADRPESEWQWDASGQVHMTTERLDIEDLSSQGSTQTPPDAPESTNLGHVHLEVTNLKPSVAFYRDVLGTELQTTTRGANFVSWNNYHHHVALNTWKHRRDTHDPNALGLTAITATTPDLSDIRARTQHPDHNTDEPLQLTDPDGITWHLQ